jgi:hypothetical protein
MPPAIEEPREHPRRDAARVPLQTLLGGAGIADFRLSCRGGPIANEDPTFGCGRRQLCTANRDFSPGLDALRRLPEGRSFSPAEIAAPALCWSRAPRSPAGAGLRGARGTGIIRRAL